MRGQLTPFSGARNHIGWTAATLGSGWTGDVTSARDGRTVSVNVDTSRVSWTDGVAVATVVDECCPTFNRYGVILSKSSGAVGVLIATTGVIYTVGPGSTGLSGCFTFVR